MYAASSFFTTFYLLLIMTLYTIFLTQMFLGIIVGHFEAEWKLVKDLQQDKSKDGKSFNVASVVWLILSKYFNERREVQEEKEKI